MDGLGLALFGLFLVSFTVSKPVSLYHQLTASSSESSESNESSSSEEATELKSTLRPIELNTLGQDILHQTNKPTAQPGLPQTTLVPSLTGQEELDFNESFIPLDPVVPVSEAERVVALDVTTPERLYTFPLTSPEPKPPRGDNM
uniref:Uncharacterized protein n=1 Tax=Cyprinus carpio TaxID=7962 RepID=A0A8C1ZX83_CYPCA